MKTATLAVVLVAATAAAAQERVIARSVRLEKDAVLHTPLVITASHITVDGNGATLQGPGKRGDRRSFAGTGVTAVGCSHVTLKNLTVRGFERGLAARDGTGWRLEGCDFSDNYHDPDYGWGDYKRAGGIILTRLSKSTITGNRANRVWNGLDLEASHENLIERNDFSHCSNVCLKLWRSCRNRIRQNNLSHGLRIRPGEVHARDSTCVLIESGSDHNRFERNDATHGGDGIFIRVLNGWVSTGNVFIENDTSFANNNGFEAWSPGNTYLRNRANHCSFGFWLGGSDHTVLVGNEAAWNGLATGHHNAPEADFGHGGIVIVHGSGSHTVIDGNHCHHNNGAGIVFRGDLGSRGAKWKMFHLVVQRNRLEHNRWGLFARFTDWLDLGGNRYQGNDQDEFLEEVTHLTRHPADPDGRPPPVAVLEGPTRALVGRTVVFDASGSSDPGRRPLAFRWDVGGRSGSEPVVRHVFERPGFYRVGVTVTNGYLSSLAYRDVYAVKPGRELATEGQAARWTWTMGNNAGGQGRVHFEDDPVALVGRTSLHLRPDPYRGADVTAVFRAPRHGRWRLTRKRYLAFWLRFRNPNNGGFQGTNPIVRLHAGRAAYTYLPASRGVPRNLLGDLPCSEARHGWLHVRVPLGGGEGWIRTESVEGRRPPHLDHGLRFVTVPATVETQNASALVSAGKYLFLATRDGGRLFKSRDGTRWIEQRKPADDLPGAAPEWENGMLAFHAGAGSRGRLYLALRHPQRNRYGQQPRRLAAYDIAAGAWSWLPTETAMGHGATVAGSRLFGLAHAVAGNFGGPLCRVDLGDPPPLDEHSVIGGLQGSDAHWLSRAAQLATLEGKVYGIKNDWQTPQPPDAGRVGDRLFAFDPAAYAPSRFTAGNRWNDRNWRAAETPARDLGPLPFEVGQGASLTPLPPGWGPGVGAGGGLFITAGCSPANHEGWGAPSDLYALYDVASRHFTLGRLPDATGRGTSAAFHQGRIFIKRGGLHHGAFNRELWIVTPLTPAEARAATGKASRERMSLERVDALSLQFDSMGYRPFDIWIDGLAFE